ncbi:MAG TPA: AAA family ATPase, partial [Gemmatimonadales bacterium]|nr:AAA family ATPase [Gemmatimonadales bacterium]
MTGLVLTLFGPPSARTGEAPAALPAKALGLLAYLALEPGNHTRESLAALFWGESDDDSARASLRQALKHIRDALGDVIRADRHSVCLAVPVDCDLRRFLEVSRAEPHAAVRYDVPHLFAGLVVRDAPAFDEWMDTMRRHALRRYIDALREEARSAVTRSRWRHALELAEQWLGSDPLSEEATGVAMEALYCQGSRAAALERFREYRDRLKKEIGSRPGEALADLARRIEHAAGVAEPASEGEGAPRFEADLVGREAQWLELVQVWGAVPSGARSAVLVGEAGIGKTRLAEEFTRWAMARGATLLRGQGYKPSGEAPFGPIASALRDTLTAPGLAGTDPEWLAEVARVVPELNRRFPRLPPASASPGLERIRLFEGVAQILTSLAAERPTILFLDDLQWCEGESCALVSFLRRRLEAVPVLFLATVTAGELVRGTPAEQLAEELGTRPGGQTIAVTPLGEAEVWQLVRQMGNIRTPTGARRFARRLYEVSDGNPFQVIEVTKLLFS